MNNALHRHTPNCLYRDQRKSITSDRILHFMIYKMRITVSNTGDYSLIVKCECSSLQAKEVLKVQGRVHRVPKNLNE